jgi:hypothetical protein
MLSRVWLTGGVNGGAGAGSKRRCIVLRWIVPLVLVAAPAAAAASPNLSASSWWEKIIVTMTKDGKAQACRYETSQTAATAKDCQVVGADGLAAKAEANDQFARITFERRFTPGGAQPSETAIDPGDELLGQQVMALAIDEAGTVTGCKIVAASGETGVAYGCNEVAAEHFEATRSSGSSLHREGYITILVYGHTEHVV